MKLNSLWRIIDMARNIYGDSAMLRMPINPKLGRVRDVILRTIIPKLNEMGVHVFRTDGALQREYDDRCDVEADKRVSFILRRDRWGWSIRYNTEELGWAVYGMLRKHQVRVKWDGNVYNAIRVMGDLKRTQA